jgi:hypothetical protein
MGFFETLLLLFIALKLMGFIAWSWWLIFLPLYPAIVIWILVILFIALKD